jgi:hypothetical protein
MAAGGVKMLVGGGVVVAGITVAAKVLGQAAIPVWLFGGALGLGGLAVVTGHTRLPRAAGQDQH